MSAASSSENTQSEEGIRSEIVAAFAKVDYPPDNSIVLDPDDPDQQDWLGILYRHHWAEIDEDYEVLWGCLWEFTPEAFQFYLPGFLIYCLKNIDEASVLLALIEQLNPSEKDDGGRSQTRFDLRISLLSQEQRHTINHFWTFVRNTVQDDWPEELERTHFWDNN